jgi:signal transduction histidine kinase
MSRSLRSSQEVQLTQFAHQFANHIHHDLDSLRQRLKHIAGSRTLELYSQSSQSGMLKEFFIKNSEPFSKLVYLNKDGVEEIAILNDAVSTTLFGVQEQQIIKQIQSNPNTVVFSEPYYSDEIEAAALQVAILQQGYFHDEFIGIVVGTVALEWFKYDMAETTIGKYGFFRLIDQDSIVLLSPNPDEILSPLISEEKGFFLDFVDSVGITKQRINGIDGFVAHMPVPNTDWSILVTLPVSEFAEGITELRTIIVTLSTILFLVAFLLSLLFSGLITRPIEQLITASENVGKGDFKQEIDITSLDEMGTLARSFNTMTAKLAALRQRDERLVKEKEQAEQKLHRAEKMKAIGMMAGGVAHDLNNILSGVVSYPELLLLKMPEDSEFRPSVEAIKTSGERAVAVVADLLTVARGVASTKEVSSLDTLVTTFINSAECATLCAHYPEIHLETDLSSETTNIYCSPIHIHKLLLNLVMNGFEAISGAGTVTISSEKQIFEEQQKETNTEIIQWVVLRVSDTGAGISEQDIKQIFEPYYSKKVLGRSGTGLGLAVGWNIVKEHNGHITVESDKYGTVFTIQLPVSTDNMQERPPVPSYLGMEGRGTILVIDDEALLRDIAEQMLTSLGYTVTAVSSGEEAIEYLKIHSVELLLLDMLMEPGINGRETYSEIIKLHPGQKAIVVSGFSGSNDVRATLHNGAGAFIKKPYTMKSLGMAVKKEFGK